MSISEEIAQGHGETLKQASRRIPPTRSNRPVTHSCLYRWALQGTKLPSGERVFLETRRLAGKLITTPQAIRRFLEQQTPAQSATCELPRSSSERKRASDRAVKDLEELGIK